MVILERESKTILFVNHFSPKCLLVEIDQLVQYKQKVTSLTSLVREVTFCLYCSKNKKNYLMFASMFTSPEIVSLAEIGKSFELSFWFSRILNSIWMWFEFFQRCWRKFMNIFIRFLYSELNGDFKNYFCWIMNSIW